MSDTTSTARPTAAQTAHAASLTPWRLARMAGVSDPDSLTSPGAAWLRARTDDALEIMSNAGPDASEWDTDDISAAADYAVPIYTHELWQVFTDLAAWQVDISDFGGFTDMENGARQALYATSETLITALLSELDDVVTDDEEA